MSPGDAYTWSASIRALAACEAGVDLAVSFDAVSRRARVEMPTLGRENTLGARGIPAGGLGTGAGGYPKHVD